MSIEQYLHPEWMKGCAKCRDCGRTVHDFISPDDLWKKAWGNGGGVLCYDCFCERLAQKEIYITFTLSTRLRIASDTEET